MPCVSGTSSVFFSMNIICVDTYNVFMSPFTSTTELCILNKTLILTGDNIHISVCTNLASITNTSTLSQSTDYYIQVRFGCVLI